MTAPDAVNEVQSKSAAAEAAQAEADKLVAMGVLVVDPHGRRWLMLGSQRGFTRSTVDGCWWYGERFNPRSTPLVPVTSTYVVRKLDEWETTVADVVPAEPVGVQWGHGLVAS